jgi:hypothetical protein
MEKEEMQSMEKQNQAMEKENQAMKQEKPLFYREPIALNREAHRRMRVGKSANGYAFAAKTHSVILAPVEFFEACKEYPIIFSTSPEGAVVPIALLGFRAGENLMVDSEGNWDARYIPAYVRRYPFILSETGPDNLTVCVDQAFDGLYTKRDGEPIFTREGAYSDYMKQTMEFLRNFHIQFKNSAPFGEKLKELDLLKPMDALVELNDGQKFALNGFLVVDEQKLQALSDEDLASLFRPGYLALIYSHLLSLSTMSGLVDRLSHLAVAA